MRLHADMLLCSACMPVLHVPHEAWMHEHARSQPQSLLWLIVRRDGVLLSARMHAC